uniref:AraC family transcriptional regulator n=1 Tax=Carnobacterium sp. TaxID=48221 RepID=UPI00344C3D4E
MYTDSKAYLDKEEQEELSILLGNIQYIINSYGKWDSIHDTKLEYTSSDFELLYYSKGGSITKINGIEYQCKPGMIVVIEPFSLVSTTNQGYETYEYYSIHFDIQPAYLQVQLTNLLVSNGPMIEKDEYTDISGMFAKLYLEKLKKNIGYISVITSGLLRIIVEIIRVQQERNPLPVQQIEYDQQQVQTINHALCYIDNHKSDAIKITAICTAIGVSNSYLYKSFITIMGISPSKFILQFKIKKAKELLRLNTYSVTEIGLLLGFSSTYHFSNTFKSITNITPKKYRLTELSTLK